jgi:hypothetical protein
MWIAGILALDGLCFRASKAPIKYRNQMKFGLKELKVPLGIFDFTVIFVFGPREKLQNYLRWKYEDKNLIVTPSDNPLGECGWKTGYCPVVWLPHKPKTVRELATLSHECCHAMFDLFGWARIGINRETEEVLCHGVGFLVKTVLGYSLADKTENKKGAVK